jgi:hypothetical protein
VVSETPHQLEGTTQHDQIWQHHQTCFKAPAMLGIPLILRAITDRRYGPCGTVSTLLKVDVHPVFYATSASARNSVFFNNSSVFQHYFSGKGT